MCDLALRKGDVYYADLDGFRGHEQGGVRPVLILQNNIGNKYAPTTLVAPLTTSITKKPMPMHVKLSGYEYGLKQDSTVLLEQIRAIDKCRLKGYLASIDKDKMYEIDKRTAIVFGLEGKPASIVAA